MSCVTSSSPRGVSWGQEVDLLPDWRTSWRQEACQIGEGPGRNHPCWRPGSPWLEGGRGEPWAASCSSGQLSTSSWERTRGPEGRGEVSQHLLQLETDLGTHLDTGAQMVAEPYLGVAEILFWLLMREHKTDKGPSTRSFARIERWTLHNTPGN